MIPEWLVKLAIPGIAILMLAGFYAIMDARHEPRGAIIKSELREVRREIRSLEHYEELAPSEQYSPARKAQIRELRQAEKELVEDL